MKKIIFDASPLVDPRMSGIGHATLEIIKFMAAHPGNRKDFEIILAISFNKIDLVERWKIEDVVIKAIPCHMRLFNILWKFDLLPPMDLICGKGTYVFTNYRNWRLFRSKSITYVHDISFVLFPEFVSPKNQQFLAKNLPKWMHRTEFVVADSHSAGKEIQDYYKIDKQKLKILHHGVDGKVFYKRSLAEVKKVKEKHGIDGKYIFYIGNIEPRKNISNLILAYRKLPERIRNDCSLLLVGGSGWLNEPIMDLIKVSKQEGYKIILPDSFVEDGELPALYSGAVMLAHPALYEGFGLSIVQAMSCGTPVIAGNNSSMVEVVGSAGLLVEPGDINEISAKMERLISDQKLRDDLSKKGVKQAKQFSWENTAAELVKIAENL